MTSLNSDATEAVNSSVSKSLSDTQRPHKCLSIGSQTGTNPNTNLQCVATLYHCAMSLHHKSKWLLLYVSWAG